MKGVYAMATSLEISERVPDRRPAPKTLSFGEKIAKISAADTQIIVLRAIIKKDKKKETRNAWQSLANSPLGAVVSPPSK